MPRLAGAGIRFRAPTRAGDELVATAVERERDARDGTYDVTVTVGETVPRRRPVGVAARVEVLPPYALERSLGKARRISDQRPR